MKPLTEQERPIKTVDPAEMEKYSSAITLSDMEIFIYPELLYSLVLANIMSPRIWAWREDDWFRKMDKMSPIRRVQRLKQYIIDHYEFNLDLDTWGLTTKQQELDRFKGTIDEETLSQSNALFGYEGDKYYFDMDIRRHFGLDKYEGDTIPYWKTETVEAMDAFKFKEGYRAGAGECVSLSTLYAAALFIVCEIPLEQIYLLATPLHSQNFIDLNEGVLTNNRRLVTKNMWFNGTELTSKAQRALRNERITIVANNTGYIHTVYPQATIAKDSYDHFKTQLRSFLKTEVNAEILGNFLRDVSSLQTCFQFCHTYHGKLRFIEAEKVYAYEHGGPYKASDNTKSKLLESIEDDEFYCESIEGRVCIENFESFFWEYKVSFDDPESVERLKASMTCPMSKADDIIDQLKNFCQLEPRLPGENATFVETPAIKLTPGMSREDVITYLLERRDQNPVIDLAFYAHRDMSRVDWTPFMKAAMERNPACAQAVLAMNDEDVIKHILSLTNESIYDGPRLAQPDEVWNFQRGDGLERAITLATIWKSRHPDATIQLESRGVTAKLSLGDREVSFESRKGLNTAHTL